MNCIHFKDTFQDTLWFKKNWKKILKNKQRTTSLQTINMPSNPKQQKDKGHEFSGSNQGITKWIKQGQGN